MNLQKDIIIIKQVLEQYMESEISPWTLESPMTTLKIESLSASTATSMDTWQRNTDRRKKKQRSVSNARKKNILQKTAEKSK